MDPKTEDKSTIEDKKSDDINLNSGSISTTRKIITFVIVCWALLAAYGLYTLPGSFLPLYNLDRGISVTVTSWVLAAVPLFYVIVCFPSAWLLNNYSSKRILLGSIALDAIATFILAAVGYVTNNTVFIAVSAILRMIQGVCGGIIDCASFSIAARLFPQHLALMSSLVQSTMNTAIAVSPFIGAVLYEDFSFLVAFAGPAGIVSVAFFLGLFVMSDVDCRQVPEEKQDRRHIGWTKWFTTYYLIIHTTFCQFLINFYIPILAPYVKDAFGKGAVFAGICLLVNTIGNIMASPIVGRIMDRFNPYITLVITIFTLPVTYIFLGPAPFLKGIAPASPTQLLVVLALIGGQIPMACFPAVLIMQDVHRLHGFEVTQADQNFMFCIYCSAYGLGGFLGVLISGFMAESLNFADSVSIMGYICILESVLLLGYCWWIRKTKQKAVLQDKEKICPKITYSESAEKAEIYYNAEAN